MKGYYVFYIILLGNGELHISESMKEAIHMADTFNGVAYVFACDQRNMIYRNKGARQ